MDAVALGINCLLSIPAPDMSLQMLLRATMPSESSFSSFLFAFVFVFTFIFVFVSVFVFTFVFVFVFCDQDEDDSWSQVQISLRRKKGREERACGSWYSWAAAKRWEMCFVWAPSRRHYLLRRDQQDNKFLSTHTPKHSNLEHTWRRGWKGGFF